MSVNTILKKLCALPGVSGREDAVRSYILQVLAASPVEMEVTVDRLGSVIARLKGREPAPCRVLFAAHMDEVGLMVTGITDEGYLRFVPVGGIDSRVLFARRVRVNGHIGVIGGKAVHQCTEKEKETPPDAGRLLIDLGCDSREAAEKMAAPGDVAVFDSGYEKMQGGLFQARALDDRAGCALLLSLAGDPPPYDVTLAFTVQEEVGLRGAGAVAFAGEPECAGVGAAPPAAETAGVPADRQVCRQGKGPVLSFMDRHALYDRPLYDWIAGLAAEEKLPVQPKTAVAGGNDAGAIQRTKSGCRVAAVSLPCRYLHTPSCALRKEDLRDTLALLRLLRDRLPAAGI